MERNIGLEAEVGGADGGAEEDGGLGAAEEVWWARQEV